MYNSLSNELKKEIKVEVKMHYLLEPSSTDEKIVRILSSYSSLKVESQKIRYYGPCTEINCTGEVTLLEAENIVHVLHNVPIHSTIHYINSSFKLTE